MEKVNINLGNCTLTMVHVPGAGDLPGFYVSETPITSNSKKHCLQRMTQNRSRGLNTMKSLA